MINDKGQLLKQRMKMKNIGANASDFCFRFLLFMHLNINDIFLLDLKTNSPFLQKLNF